MYLMMIDVILQLYIHFSALSNSIHFSAESRDSRLKIVINEWSKIFNSNWALKAQRKWELRFARQVLSEIFKAS